MGKQGYEDVLRHKADKEVNNAPVQIVTKEGCLTTKKAYEIEVGDVVLIQINETFPCDLLLLSSCEGTGECYVTTASLDGETNLKRFIAVAATKALDTPELISKYLSGTITCQQPQADLYKFFGKIEIIHMEFNRRAVQPLSPDSLLLRGARLKNTDYVYGCAVYTGSDTKMSLNSQGKQTKYSQVERQLNNFLVVILGLLVIISFVYTICLYSVTPIDDWYIYLSKITVWKVVQEFLGFLVLFNYIIPISLYVTIEFTKFFGSMFFVWDIEMYDPENDQPAVVNTSDIIEEMGQVEYLFTDKTGTLTENSMVFQRFSVSNGAYLAKDNLLFTIPRERISTISPMHTKTTDSIGISPSDMPISVRNLFLVLALCHTVRVEQNIPRMDTNKKDKLDTEIVHQLHKTKQTLRNLLDIRKRVAPKRGASLLRRASAMHSANAAVSNVRKGIQISRNDYDYQASSPDEKAFVESCRDYGIVFHGVDNHGLLVVTVQGEIALRYRILDVLEFDSDRKCMSVILQPVIDLEDNSLELDPRSPVVVLCKGAETSITEKMSKTSAFNKTLNITGDILIDDIFFNKNLNVGLKKSRVMENVTDFASAGLRTLVIGARLLSSEKWISLKSDLDAAKSNLVNRETSVANAYKAIENDLIVVGCTGIEDKLQDGVPETLVALKKAGIQVWILTGDKEETAVNVSNSAGHFAPGISVVSVTKKENSTQCMHEIKVQLERITESRQLLGNDFHYGVVIDGQSMNFALMISICDSFLELCAFADAVLCCRLTPLQKAEIVRLMKNSRKPSPVCAAIGDGANDVSMILEAHVGFGLFGKEGRQAVRSADYAFSRFRFLKRALLFHGYHYYVRTANMVQYFFYKNLVFTGTQIFFGIFSRFSSQTIYHNLYLIIYNITMTSFPVMFYGIFEQSVSEEKLLQNPQLYRKLSNNALLSWTNFYKWISFAFWHVIIIFFGVYFLSEVGVNLNEDGIGSLEGYGAYMLLIVFITVNIKMMLTSYHLNPFVWVALFLTFVFNFGIFTISNYFAIPGLTNFDLIGVWSMISANQNCSTTYLGIYLLVSLCLIPDILYRLFLDYSMKKNIKLAAISQSEALRISSLDNEAFQNNINCTSSLDRANRLALFAKRHPPTVVNISPVNSYETRPQPLHSEPAVLLPNLRQPTSLLHLAELARSKSKPDTQAVFTSPQLSVINKSPISFPIIRPQMSYEYRRSSPVNFLKMFKNEQ